MQRPRSIISASILSVVVGAALVAGVSRSTNAGAYTPAPAPAPTAIALVDLAKLMNGLEELGVRNQQVRATQEQYEFELNELKKRNEQLETELKDVIPATDVKARQARFAEKYQLEAMYEAKVKTYQRLLDFDNGDIIRDLYGKVEKAISDFAQREGYDLVLLDDRAITLPPRATLKDYNNIIENKRILFARDGMDVTDRLITIMNNDYRATSGAAPEAPRPADAPGTTPAGRN